MSEHTVEQLKPPSQETLNAIYDRVANLTEDSGLQPKGSERKFKTLDEVDGHRFIVSIVTETGERLDPDEQLITIRIDNLRVKEEEPLLYSFYKDKISGKKRLEKDVPPPKRKLLSEDEPRGEIFAKARQLKDELMGEMEDINIRRYRGLSAVGELEAQKLLQRLNALKVER